LTHGQTDFPERSFGHAQTKGDIVKDRHMGEQGVILKNGIDRPFFRRDLVHVLAVDAQHAAGAMLKSANQAQQGGLAASGGTEEGEKFTVGTVREMSASAR
jgi:hypothetical protein